MSVIGRLDDQVDEVIIKPVGKRRQEVVEPRAPAQQPETETQKRTSEDAEEKPVQPTDLPVWLL